MKFIKYSIALLLGMAVVSCSKENGKELPAPCQDGMVTIKAGFEGDEITKAGASNGFSWLWSENDQLAVTGNGSTQVYKITEGVGSKIAEFSGKPVEGEIFTIQYPDANVASASWAGQIQVGNNNVDHLKYAASLKGVDEYKLFSFSDAWASEHNGALRQTGVLKVILHLPDTVNTVSKVTVTADVETFYPGNAGTKSKKLELDMEDVSPDSKHVVTAWMTTSWNESTVNPGEFLTVSVIIGDKTIERTMEFAREGVLKAGKVNVFDIDDTAWTYGSHYSEGRGTESSPWIIYTLDELLCMKEDLSAEAVRYFKLGADIDMAGVDWVPINNTSPWKEIDFDGDGHTLYNFNTTTTASYPSFFGLLWGKCRNVNFVNASINTTVNGVGILGGYGGTTNKPCEVKNVHVQGKISAGKTVGGLFGTVVACTIENSSADIEINAAGQLVGGLFGVDKTSPVTVRNCYTSGHIESAASIVGGIGGDMIVTGSAIYNCFSTATVKTQYIFGGILGRATANQKSSKAYAGSTRPDNHIEKCIAWNEALVSNCPDTAEHYGNGAIIAGTSIHNYLKDCIRRPDIVFENTPGNAALGDAYAFFDQENSDPETDLVLGSGTYATSYHGKAAAAGKTLSDVARDLGWDQTIWDLSSDTPKFK